MLSALRRFFQPRKTTHVSDVAERDEKAGYGTPRSSIFLSLFLQLGLLHV